MAYEMAAMSVTFNDLEGHSALVEVFKCNLSRLSLWPALFFCQRNVSWIFCSCTMQCHWGVFVHVLCYQFIECE